VRQIDAFAPALAEEALHRVAAIGERRRQGSGRRRRGHPRWRRIGGKRLAALAAEALSGFVGGPARRASRGEGAAALSTKAAAFAVFLTAGATEQQYPPVSWLRGPMVTQWQQGCQGSLKSRDNQGQRRTAGICHKRTTALELNSTDGTIADLKPRRVSSHRTLHPHPALQASPRLVAAVRVCTVQERRSEVAKPTARPWTRRPLDQSSVQAS